MWKHKNFINLQLCAAEYYNITVNGTAVSVNVTLGYMWKNMAVDNPTLYSCTDTNVVWNDGTILQYNSVDVLPTDNIISNGQYTTRAAAPTLTFKHFYDAGTIGTGTYKFRHYSQTEPTPPTYTDCLTFTGESSEFTLKATNKDWDGTLQWSTDHNTWTTLAGTEAMQSVGKKLYLRGKGNTTFGAGDGVQWQLSAKAGCSGNIQTLLDWENPPTSISEIYCYYYMFAGCTSLTSAPDLPATTLAGSCYYYMFYGCTSLTSAPELPATTLAKYCYGNMFNGCTNLTSAPELPATTLAEYCYYYMFLGCTNLTTAPDLPATTLAKYCYYYMFFGCTSLTTAPDLPATTLAKYCYGSMFFGCTSLTSAPDLPATTLAEYCYYYMFFSCTKLKINTSSGNNIFTCPTTIPSDAVSNMFGNTGGTFTGTPTAGTTYYWTE